MKRVRGVYNTDKRQYERDSQEGPEALTQPSGPLAATADPQGAAGPSTGTSAETRGA